jgi:hypothetical protein
MSFLRTPILLTHLPSSHVASCVKFLDGVGDFASTRTSLFTSSGQSPFDYIPRIQLICNTCDVTTLLLLY